MNFFVKKYQLLNVFALSLQFRRCELRVQPVQARFFSLVFTARADRAWRLLLNTFGRVEQPHAGETRAVGKPLARGLPV